MVEQKEEDAVVILFYFYPFFIKQLQFCCGQTYSKFSKDFPLTSWWDKNIKYSNVGFNFRLMLHFKACVYDCQTSFWVNILLQYYQIKGVARKIDDQLWHYQMTNWNINRSSVDANGLFKDFVFQLLLPIYVVYTWFVWKLLWFSIKVVYLI